MNTPRLWSGHNSNYSSSEYSDVFGVVPPQNPHSGRQSFQKKPNSPRAVRGPGKHPGSTIWLPPHVLELRAIMRDQGVLVVTYLCDTDTRAILSPVHLESRWLMLPQNGKLLHSQIVSAAREFYEIAIQDIPDIPIKDLNRLLKQDIEKFLKETLGRVPCVIVLIHTL